jgi:hypothetical protein
MRASASTDLILPSSCGLKETTVFKTYWNFAAARQDIFFKRMRAESPPWTDDPILQTYKFTNCYRASDRVSQFLIREVIYSKKFSNDDLFLRIVLFKLFNKIETWQAIESEIGEITCATFDVERFDKILTELIEGKKKIYSAAYIMAPPAKLGGRKHRAHLSLVRRMLDDDLPTRFSTLDTMQEAFDLLVSYPMIGRFLGYQLVTDINYSPLINFSETEFTAAGPGARDGIRKCFSDVGKKSEEDVIRIVAENQERAFRKLNLKFQSLGSRPLQLIDIQNLFCEVDKYSRVKHPTVLGVSGRSKIKQKFRATDRHIAFFYPPKWHITLPAHNSKTAR